MEKMQIEIWSDIACPYCYIGKRKLDIALSQFPHNDKVKLKWCSYELTPDLPRKASDQSYYKYLSDSYGVTLERARQMTAKTVELGALVGLQLDYDKLVVANTFDALRLVKFAGTKGLATMMEEKLFYAYFTQGKDVSSHDQLIVIAKEAGLSEAEVKDMLQGDKYKKEVNDDIQQAEQLSLNYIPWYRFNGKYVVEGSIEVSDYLDLLNRSYAEWSSGKAVESSNDSVIQGQSCTIDGVCS